MASPLGGIYKGDLSFVNALPEDIDIECPICLAVMYDANPHIVSCCGHHFCNSCIRRVKDTGGPCPYCKEEEFQVFPDKSRLRYINGLQVKCSNKGCRWKGDLKDLSLHINKGMREGECRFEVVKCKYERCNFKKRRKSLLSHEISSCSQRLSASSPPYIQSNQAHPHQNYARLETGYGTLPTPQLGDNRPRVEEVDTFISLSICCCITCILLLALPAIPFGLCAFFCSLYSISLRKKGDTERAKANSDLAGGATAAAVCMGYFWFYEIVCVSTAQIIMKLYNMY